MALEVSGLYTYPIKSCAGIALENAELTERGLAYDREWMVARYGGQMLTQRTHPQLALVRTNFEEGELRIAAPGAGEIAVPLDRDVTAGNERFEVEVFKKRGTGVDQGKEAGGFFADYLQGPKLKGGTRLLRIERPREVKPAYRVNGASHSMAFADGHSLTLASTSSLAELNRHMAQPVGMERFRPNIVVSGPELVPYDEDYWRTVRLGNLQAYVVRACARCPVPNIDQAIGILPDTEGRVVTHALRETRKGLDPNSGNEEIFFMQNLQHVYQAGVRLQVGDKVQVEERAAEPNFAPLSIEQSLNALLPRQGHRQRRLVSE